MKIYEMIAQRGPRNVVIAQGGPRHVVIARNEEEAIEATVDYLNEFQTSHLFKPDDFCASAIDADKLSEPTIIV